MILRPCKVLLSFSDNVIPYFLLSFLAITVLFTVRSLNSDLQISGAIVSVSSMIVSYGLNG